MKTYEANKDLWRTKEKWDPLRLNTLRNLTNFAISCKVVKLTVIAFCKSVNSEKQLLIEKDLRLPSYAICICIYASWEKANVHICTIYAHCAWIGYMHELYPAPYVEKHLGLPSYAIELIRATKVEKRPMCICAQFMHIVHEPHLCMNYNQHHVLENIKDYHHMQYRVNPSHQSWEKGQCAYVHYLCLHDLCTLCIPI